MEHSVFTLLSLDILVDSVLAVVNSASLKTGVHVSFQIVMFSRSEPEVGSLGPVAPLSPQDPPCGFPSGLHPCAPHSECGRVPFSLRPLQHVFFGEISDDGHSDWWEGIRQCRFDHH